MRIPATKSGRRRAAVPSHTARATKIHRPRTVADGFAEDGAGGTDTSSGLISRLLLLLRLPDLVGLCACGFYRTLASALTAASSTYDTRAFSHCASDIRSTLRPIQPKPTSRKANMSSGLNTSGPKNSEGVAATITAATQSGATRARHTPTARMIEPR